MELEFGTPERESLSAVVSLREVANEDKGFLENLYAETRRGEFAETNWTEEQIKAFMRMQFDLQNRAYQMQFPNAENYIIEFENAPAGRLIVYRNAEEIRLVDIAVSSDFRRRGIGASVIARLQREAAAENKPLALRVLKSNSSADAFYRRRGFVATDEDLYWAMRWSG